MNVVDVSSWFLIEEIADSEGDSGYPSTIAANIGYSEDDAESCTCDSTGICSQFKDQEDDQWWSGEFCADEDDIHGLDCSMWLSDSELEIECSSHFLVDDKEETRMVKVNMNEVDDKLFWEICIEMGYP